MVDDNVLTNADIVRVLVDAVALCFCLQAHDHQVVQRLYRGYRGLSVGICKSDRPVSCP